MHSSIVLLCIRFSIRQFQKNLYYSLLSATNSITQHDRTQFLLSEQQLLISKELHISIRMPPFMRNRVFCTAVSQGSTVIEKKSVKRKRKNQQDATIRCLLSTSVSTCFGHHYAHLQEKTDRVLLHMVYCAGCVVGCEH